MPGSYRLLTACLALSIAGCTGGTAPADTGATDATDAVPQSGAPASRAPGVEAGDVSDGHGRNVGTDAARDGAGAGSSGANAGEAAEGASGTAAAQGGGFSIEALPLSTQPLGDFPFFSLPEGYWAARAGTFEFAEAAFWVGSDIHRVEGRVHVAGIRRDRDVTDAAFSDLEVVRNLEAAVRSAGGVEVSAGETPQELRDPIADAMRAYHIEAKCYGHSPQQVFVIRRDDGNVWVRTCRGGKYAGLVVAQERPLEVTSALLPATALGEALAGDGRVALEVHFATDRAEILAASMPQIGEVIELLERDPSLALSIEGHTDSTGDAVRNRELSQARADSVVAAITAAGIAPGRLEASGLGDSRPVADNATDEGRARNRRVELVRRD